MKKKKCNNGLKIEDNQFKYLSKNTIEIGGEYHKNGGTDLQYGNTPVEVEKGETLHINSEGDAIIGGNLLLPYSNKKFKSAFKDVARQENKGNSLANKGLGFINTANPYNPFQALAYNTGLAMQDGGAQILSKANNDKETLGDMQQFMLDMADATGKSPEYISKSMANGGKIKAKRGASLDPKIRRGYDSEDLNSIITQSAVNYGLDPNILLNQVDAESGFNPNAVSNKGAVGFAQFLPETAKQYGISPQQLKSNKPEDLRTVADAQAHHMKDLFDANGGDPKLALIGYNGGQGAINKVRGWMGNLNATGDDIMSYWEQKRAGGASKAPNAYHNQTYDYVNSILGGGDKQKFRSNYYENPSISLPPVDPNADIPYWESQYPNTQMPSAPVGETPQFGPPQQGVNQPNSPYSPPTQGKKPSLADRNKFRFDSIIPEIAAIADRPDFVPHQHYNPDLFQPYNVSLQDRLNENNSSFRAITRSLPNNPEAASILAGQKYGADNSILADQFRTNQGISNDVNNKNVALLNDAQLKNLQLDDQQFVRQAQAKSNTKNRQFAAANSIANKVALNQRENNSIRMEENLFNYRYNPVNGEMEYVGPSAAESLNFNNISSNSDDRKEYTYDAQGRLVKKKITDYPSSKSTKKKFGGFMKNMK